MITTQIWDEVHHRLVLRADPDDILAWLEGQGINELDARRMLQYQMESVA